MGSEMCIRDRKVSRNKSSKNVGKVLDIAKDFDFGGREGSIYRNNRPIQNSPITEETVVYGDSDQYTELGAIRQSSLTSAGNIDGEMDYN